MCDFFFKIFFYLSVTIISPIWVYEFYFLFFNNHQIYVMVVKLTHSLLISISNIDEYLAFSFLFKYTYF